MKINPLMAPVDAPAASAPSAPPAPRPDGDIGVPDSDRATANNLKDGFMAAMGDSPDKAPSPRLRGRDTPMPQKPLQVAGSDKAPAKPGDKAEPDAKFTDPMDEPAAPEDQAQDPDPKKQEPPKPQGKAGENFRRLETERDTARKEAETFKKQNEELKAQLEKQKDYPKIVETLAERDKRLADQENHIRFVNFKQSEEYKTKYQEPANKAYAEMVRDMPQYQVELPGKPTDDGSPVQSAYRPATEADFVRLYQMQEGQAWAESRKMFGDAAPAIMEHRRTLKQLARGAQEAEENYRQNGAKIEGERQVQTKLEQEKLLRSWEDENQRITNALPGILKEQEKDEEFNKVLGTAREMVDVAYSDKRNTLPPDTRAKLDAKIRNRAVGYSTLTLLRQRDQATIKQLQAKIAELEGGAPGVPSSGRGAGESKGGDSAPDGSLESHFNSYVSRERKR
jgi:hypothetical protein